MLEFENFDTESLVSPIKVNEFIDLLVESNYPENKIQFIKQGFTEGFDIGYRGKEDIKLQAPNLRLTIASEKEIWNKVMKEVQHNRFAGPFEQIPFENYIQSPIGLVSKDHGTDTRLIFHLSYPRNKFHEDGTPMSVNANIPEQLTRVKYPDFSEAIELCLKEGVGCHISRTDIKSAFRNVGISKNFWKFLVMKAKHPITKKWYYFFYKCLSFGASSSCAIFQKISDSIAHIIKFRTNKSLVNYLDDYLYAALLKIICDDQVKVFIEICDTINLPIAIDKTAWG